MGAAQCGLREHKKIVVWGTGRGKRGYSWSKAKLYSCFLARAGLTKTVSFFLLIIGF
jgi:hypothetical protein